MNLTSLLQNPEKYRIGNNYKASHIVFPVKFDDEKYIVKKPRFGIASLIQTYYTWQDQAVGGTRNSCSGEEALAEEARKLQQLQFGAPKLIAYERGILVREYLDGKDFRTITDAKQQKMVLQAGLDILIDVIHPRDVVMGATHVKNIFCSKDQTYWLDFDGVFDEHDISQSKAADIWKFICSTYTCTQNFCLTENIIEYANFRLQGEPVIRHKLSALAQKSCEEGGKSFYWTTRMSPKSIIPLMVSDVFEG